MIKNEQPDGSADDFTRIAVAKALCKWRNGKRSSVGFTELPMVEQHAYFEQADDAIAAYLERQPKREIGFVEALAEAKKIVEAYPLYSKFINGTPLQNDIAVMIAEFAVKGGKP